MKSRISSEIDHLCRAAHSAGCIHRSVLDRVLEFCTYDRVTPDGEEYYLVNYPFIERDYYYDMLLSLGDKCECLSPARVREELKRRLQSMTAIYQDS